MANPIPCDLNDDQATDYIIGIAASGEQMFLCSAHAAQFGLTLALATLPADDLQREVAAALAPPAPNGQEETGATPARKRRPKKAAAEDAHAGTEPRLQEATPGADDR